MKPWKSNIIIASILFSAAVVIFGQSWFPNGSQPSPGDNEQRSLQKINYLMFTGAGGGAAPVLTNATQMAFTGKTAVLSSSGSTLAQVATDVNDSIWVRQVIIEADPSNSQNITVKAGGGTPPVFTKLAAGNEYVLTASTGGVIDLKTITVSSESTGATTVTIVYLQ